MSRARDYTVFKPATVRVTQSDWDVKCTIDSCPTAINDRLSGLDEAVIVAAYFIPNRKQFYWKRL